MKLKSLCMGYKEVIEQNVYENYEVRQKNDEQQQISNVLKTIDQMVKEQASTETDNISCNIRDCIKIFETQKDWLINIFERHQNGPAILVHNLLIHKSK